MILKNLKILLKKQVSDCSIVVISLYVDDFFILYNDIEKDKFLKLELHKQNATKDLWIISYV